MAQILEQLFMENGENGLYLENMKRIKRNPSLDSGAANVETIDEIIADYAARQAENGVPR
jgi:hypothetical protein